MRAATVLDYTAIHPLFGNGYKKLSNFFLCRNFFWGRPVNVQNIFWAFGKLPFFLNK